MWKAEADDLTGHQGTTRLVAVKTVKEGASDREKEDLDRELEIMKQLGSHPNVVTLLGCCTEEGKLYMTSICLYFENFFVKNVCNAGLK